MESGSLTTENSSYSVESIDPATVSPTSPIENMAQDAGAERQSSSSMACSNDNRASSSFSPRDSQASTSSTSYWHPVDSNKVYHIKTGCGVELAAAECLGNKLMVFGGRRDDRDIDSNRILTKSIKTANVDEFLTTGDGASNPVWETVGRLSHPMIVFMTAKLKINKVNRGFSDRN